MTLCGVSGKPMQTRDEARKHSRSMGSGVEAYRCTDCGAWHVGSMRRRRKQARKHAA